MLSRRYRNLVSASSLAQELEAYLRAREGSAPLEDVCREILLVPPRNQELAAQLVAGLVGDDPRFVSQGDRLRLHEETPEDVWARRRHFAVVDVETTMGGPHSQRIIEVAICTLADGRLESWSSLVHPGRGIPRWISELTGISDAAVSGAPRFEEIAQEVAERLEDAILVAHHARFDVAALSSEFERAFGRRLRSPYLCTVELARHFLPGPENYRLETISRYLRLKHERPHRAWSDAETAALLFREIEACAGAELVGYLRPRPASGPKPRRERARAFGQER